MRYTDHTGKEHANAPLEEFRLHRIHWRWLWKNAEALFTESWTQLRASVQAPQIFPTFGSEHRANVNFEYLWRSQAGFERRDQNKFATTGSEEGQTHDGWVIEHDTGRSKAATPRRDANRGSGRGSGRGTGRGAGRGTGRRTRERSAVVGSMSASPEDVFKAADKAWREKGGLTAKTAAYAGMDGAEKTAYKECLEKGTMNGQPAPVKRKLSEVFKTLQPLGCQYCQGEHCDN